MAIEDATISYFSITFEEIMKTDSFVLSDDYISFETILYNPTHVYGVFKSEVYTKHRAYMVPYDIIVFVSDDDLSLDDIKLQPYSNIETQTFAALDT